MRLNRKLGLILLAIWLVAQGILQFVPINIPGREYILAGLAIVAGLLILIDK